MSTPLSVVMPTYNGEKFIAAAIESVRLQADEGIELVIVDDGSSDKTLEIVREFANSITIKLIEPGRVGNWVAMTNIGLREANGEWACFLHQDDMWLPGRLAKIRKQMTMAQGAMVVHNCIFSGPNGARLGRSTCPFGEGNVGSAQFIERLLVQNFIALPATAFRRKAAIETGGLDESLWFSADWDLWLRLGAMGPIRFLPECLTAFRIHSESQTVARKLAPGEWRQQLTTVLYRHLPAWDEQRRQSQVQRAAEVSVSINSALAALSRGERAGTSRAFLQLLLLGPNGWRRYLRDSRILQRLKPRILMLLLGHSERGNAAGPAREAKFQQRNEGEYATRRDSRSHS